jgi:orotate phosphoribosyltransferase
MQGQKIENGNAQGPARGLDCLRFEDLEPRWDSLADEEILWCADHIQRCALGIHTEDGAERLRSMAPEEVMKRLLPAEVEAMLSDAGAIERDRPDYEVHPGLHSDLHINVAKLCYSEHLLERTATILDSALSGIDFDAVVAAGWAMATIVRRTLRFTSRSSGDCIVAEGYGPPTLLGRVKSGATVVLLLDVSVTGRLVSDLATLVQAQGGRVIDALAIVEGGHVVERVASFRSLCSIPMNLAPADQCPRSDSHPAEAFNPVRGGMTTLKTSPRTVTGHLRDEPDAAELWDFVNCANAFQQHHRENRRHYVPFIDTHRLLSHPAVGMTIIAKLATLVLQNMEPPDAVLVRHRSRSRMLGKKLVEALRSRGIIGVQLIVAGVRQSRFSFMHDGEEQIRHRRRVLVADTAAAHGETIDELALLASCGGLRNVGGALVVSHLSEACEEAFRHRLSGGFVRLYSFPGRPWNDTCPVCNEAQRLRWVVEHLADGPVRSAARWELAQLQGAPPTAQQLPLLFSAKPLSVWHAGVAAGAASHTLSAVQGDGMAPLSLPEIDDMSIPLKNRVSLLKAWRRRPAGRTGPPLHQELLGYLRREFVEPALWLEAIRLLAYQGTVLWVDCLEDHLRRQPSWLDKRVCAQVALATFLPDRGGEEARRRLSELAERFATTTTTGKLLRNVLASAHA